MIVITALNDKIDKSIMDNREKDSDYQETGLVSGSKLSLPTLWAVLTMLGIPDPKDAYTYRKFQRGNDVHARAKEHLTGVLMKDQVDNVEMQIKDAPLSGTITLEKEGGYRGGSANIDIMQINSDGEKITHEIKSATKEGFERIAKKAYDFGIKGKVYPKGPSYGHIIQSTYYALSQGSDKIVVHYLNSNDYMMSSFYMPIDKPILIQTESIACLNVKRGAKTQELMDEAKQLHPDKFTAVDAIAEVNEAIDAIYLAFELKEIPVFEAVEGWNSIPKYQAFKGWNELTAPQILDKLKHEYPEAYDKFMSTTFEG